MTANNIDRPVFAIVRARRHMGEKVEVTCACPICRREHSFIADESMLVWALGDGVWPLDCAEDGPGDGQLQLVARYTAREFLSSYGIAIPAYRYELHGPDWQHPGLRK
jgi:hypothetical protein